MSAQTEAHGKPRYARSTSTRADIPKDMLQDRCRARPRRHVSSAFQQIERAATHHQIGTRRLYTASRLGKNRDLLEAECSCPAPRSTIYQADARLPDASAAAAMLEPASSRMLGAKVFWSFMRPPDTDHIYRVRGKAQAGFAGEAIL